ncbi:MAG: hypothetical protein WCG95_08805, partial [bacterium]
YCCTYCHCSNIGNGVVIGAGSVVKGVLLPYGIYVGNPARLIKKRFSDKIIRILESISWWNWSDKKISQNSEFFSLDLTKLSDDELENILSRIQ